MPCAGSGSSRLCRWSPRACFGWWGRGTFRRVAGCRRRISLRSCRGWRRCTLTSTFFRWPSRRRTCRLRVRTRHRRIPAARLWRLRGRECRSERYWHRHGWGWPHNRLWDRAKRTYWCPWCDKRSWNGPVSCLGWQAFGTVLPLRQRRGRRGTCSRSGCRWDGRWRVPSRRCRGRRSSSSRRPVGRAARCRCAGPCSGGSRLTIRQSPAWWKVRGGIPSYGRCGCFPLRGRLPCPRPTVWRCRGAALRSPWGGTSILRAVRVAGTLRAPCGACRPCSIRGKVLPSSADGRKWRRADGSWPWRVPACFPLQNAWWRLWPRPRWDRWERIRRACSYRRRGCSSPCPLWRRNFPHSRRLLR